MNLEARVDFTPDAFDTTTSYVPALLDGTAHVISEVSRLEITHALLPILTVAPLAKLVPVIMTKLPPVTLAEAGAIANTVTVLIFLVPGCLTQLS